MEQQSERIRSSADIAKLNDLLRTTMMKFPGTKIILTEGARGPDREDVITAVRAFKDFNEDNDPHGEHDCASFEVNGKTYMFKIDYYDENFEYGSDPYTDKVVHRVLTIMRSHEY